MKCGKCGAENLDGAEYCNSCRAPLAVTPGRPGASRSSAGLWIGIAAAAVFAIVLVVVFANGGGGGGSVGSPNVAQSPSPGQVVLTQEEKRLVATADREVMKRYPDMKGALRSLSKLDFQGKELVVVGYSRKVATSGGGTPATIPVTVIVTIDPSTRGVTYDISL